jgi:hypothetical protein
MLFSDIGDFFLIDATIYGCAATMPHQVCGEVLHLFTAWVVVLM